MRLKVSHEGANWTDAMVVDNNTGSVAFPAGIAAETGTFTLSLGTTVNGAYSGATGINHIYANYTRIGDLCYCRFTFTITGLISSDLTAGSALHLRGLPFDVANLSGPVDQVAAGSVYRSIGSGLNTLLGGYCSHPDNIYLFAFASNNAQNTDNHYFSFHYQIA